VLRHHLRPVLGDELEYYLDWRWERCLGSHWVLCWEGWVQAEITWLNTGLS
jgi:hypothetical protein